LQQETKQLLEEFQQQQKHNFRICKCIENKDESMDQIKSYIARFNPINITVDDKGKQSKEMVFPWAIKFTITRK
jgi:hypothetical protein